jgi:hypothetical protein
MDSNQEKALKMALSGHNLLITGYPEVAWPVIWAKTKSTSIHVKDWMILHHDLEHIRGFWV